MGLVRQVQAMVPEEAARERIEKARHIDLELWLIVCIVSETAHHQT